LMNFAVKYVTFPVLIVNSSRLRTNFVESDRREGLIVALMGSVSQKSANLYLPLHRKCP